MDHIRGGATEPDINVFGPLTRSCDDLELLFDVLLRREAPWVPQLPPAPDDVGSLRVAAWLDDPYCPVDGDVLSVMHAALEALEGSGVSVDHDARPDIDPLPAWETGLWLVRAAMTLAGRGEGPNHRDWLEHHITREECRRKWAKFFTRYDAILMPVSFHPPFDHMQGGTFAERRIPANGVERPYIEMTRWTILTGMSYLPGTVPPLGPHAPGPADRIPGRGPLRRRSHHDGAGSPHRRADRRLPAATPGALSNRHRLAPLPEPGCSEPTAGGCRRPPHALSGQPCAVTPRQDASTPSPRAFGTLRLVIPTVWLRRRPRHRQRHEGHRRRASQRWQANRRRAGTGGPPG